MGHTNEPEVADAPRPDLAVRNMIMGFRLTQLIYVAAKLGIADLLTRGPRTADDLAAASGAHPRALNMLVVTGGLERTEAEYAALLAAAGFSLSRIVPSSCPLSIIEALPNGAV